MHSLINELGNKFLNGEIVDKLWNDKQTHFPQKSRSEFAAVVCQVRALAWAPRGRRKVWGHGGAVLWAWPRSGGRLRQVFPGAAVGGAYEQAVWRGTAAGARHYWLGSTGWDQPIQSTSEPRPIGPPELQNPTALLLSSAKKSAFLIPQANVFFFFNVILVEELWNFWVEKKQEGGKCHVWLGV